MCELFGVTSSEKVGINKLLEEFYNHSVKHCHGWGLATFDDNIMEINKGKERAIDSCVLKDKLSLPINVKVALGHIRYATIGHVEDENCHPFTEETIAYYEKRKALELDTIKSLTLHSVIIDNTNYNWDKMFDTILHTIL